MDDYFEYYEKFFNELGKNILILEKIRVYSVQDRYILYLKI